MDVRVGLYRKLSTEQLMLLICGVEEDSWEFLGLQVHPKGNKSWIFTGRTDAEAEAPNFDHLMQRADSLEKTWCWERLKAGGKGDDRGWDGWMASLTQWTWVWSSSGRWWRTRKPGVLQFIGLKRIKNNWVTEQHQYLNHLVKGWEHTFWSQVAWVWIPVPPCIG